MDVDEVPAANSSRPHRLAPVYGQQERVQRHFVEQLVEPVRGVPVLDAPVPQMVDQLSGFLKHDIAQVIDVPKIPLDSTPLRRPLSELQMVEQLVEVPVPESVLVACGMELRWRRMAPVRGCGRDLLVHGTHDLHQEEGTPVWVHRQPRAARQILGKAEAVRRPLVVDVPVLFSDKFLQSKEVDLIVPQIQLIFKVWDIPVVEQRRVTHSANCAEDWKFARCSSWEGVDMAVGVQTTGSWFRQCGKPCWCRR